MVPSQNVISRRSTAEVKLGQFLEISQEISRLLQGSPGGPDLRGGQRLRPHRPLLLLRLDVHCPAINVLPGQANFDRGVRGWAPLGHAVPGPGLGDHGERDHRAVCEEGFPGREEGAGAGQEGLI